jgi:hypothetical protein
VNERSNRIIRPHRVRFAAAGVIESLEARAYLSGVVLGAPVNLATASAGIAPVFANLADFNGDNKADLFVANSTDSVSVLTGNGDGSFAAPVTIPVTNMPLPLATGQFTGSGNLDIIAGTSSVPGSGLPGDISVILGNGNGTFAAANNVPALDNNQAIAVGDFNNDGNQDVITVSNSATPSNNAEVLFGNGQGGLTAFAPFSLPFGGVSTVAVGDFNGDGNLDFVVANQLNSSASVFLGNGNGTFQAPVTYKTGPSPTSLVVADFTGQTLTNGMPKLGIVTADSTGGEVSFLGNNGDGTFAAAVNSPVAGSGPGGGPLKVRLANFTTTNSTTEQDLVVLLSPNSSADATVLLGNGDGTFRLGTTIATNGDTRNAIAAGNINTDNLTDVVLTNSKQVTSLLNVTGLDNTAPTAMVNATQLPGSTLLSTYDFSVTYTDSLQVDASTLGAGNLIVTFPDGTTHQAATLTPGQNLGNAATITAKYRITFPSDLTAAQNGPYTVTLNGNSVTNANGVAAAAGNIGSFTLNVVTGDNTPPTAAVSANQAPAVAGATTYNFTVLFSDDVAVDATTIVNHDLTVTFPGNVQTQPATLVSTALMTGAMVLATYQITFSSPLTSAANGGYQVFAGANGVKDTSGNALVAGNIGAFTLTVATTPTAAVDSVQTTPSTSSNTYNFTVTYADSVAINAATLGNGNLTVTPPGGGAPIAATLVSTGLTNSTNIDATYQIAFGSNLSPANNGVYQVNIAGNSVFDTSAPPSAVPAGGVGSFTLTVPTAAPAPTGDFAVSAVTGKIPAAAVTGGKQKAGPSVIVTYNGATTLVKATVTVTLYTSSTQIHDSSAAVAGVPVTKKLAKLKPGKSFAVHFKPFSYPATAGSYYLVSDVTLNGALDSYDGATSTPITVAAAFVDANALAATPVKTSLAAGAKASAFITVQNLGNVAYSGPATVDVALVPAGGGTPTVVAAAVPVTLHLTVGQTKKVKLNFVPANLPASGSYNITLTINVPGDTNAANNAVTSTVAVTI